MNKKLRAWWTTSSLAFSLTFAFACNEGDGSTDGSSGTSTGGDTYATGGSGVGGVTATGGTASGGATSGGASSGGAGGTPASGGTASGGVVGAGGLGSGGLEGSGGTAATGGSGGGVGGGDASGGSGSGGGGSTEPVFHVFLLLGQSNMAGYPKAQAADKTENPRIKVLGFDACGATGRVADQWDTAAPPLHECWNGAIGPGDYFAKTLIDEYPAQDTIGLVPSAISGEKVETFMKAGGSKYSWLMSRAKAAQDAGGVIEGILFHQGESNCGDPAWPGKVKTLVSDLRADLGLGNVPFLAGELLYTGNCKQHNSLVNQLPSQITNAFVVSAQGLAGDPADTQWNLHFGHDAQVTFGTRYAEKMISALGL